MDYLEIMNFCGFDLEKTQLNDNTLRAEGFDPEKAETHTRVVLHRQTKCADIY